MRPRPRIVPKGERFTTLKASGLSAVSHNANPCSRNLFSAVIRARSALYSKSGMALHSRMITRAVEASTKVASR